MKILILGVTASGKGRLGFDLACKIGAEILSVDSMKVYRRMDIGTAKPSVERQGEVKYHLIDVVEPYDSFSVGRYLELADEAVEAISAADKPIIAVGGTAMYIKNMLYGLFDGPDADAQIRERLKAQIEAEGTGNLFRKLSEVDAEAAERIHPNDQKRIIRAMEVFELTGKPISSYQQQFGAEKMLGDWHVIGLRRPKDEASGRINRRVKRMVEEGLVDEVGSLLAEDKALSQQARRAIGYAEIIAHISGEMTLSEAIEKIKINTRRFAKSQRTWFKTFREVNWLDVAEDDAPEEILERAMAFRENN